MSSSLQHRPGFPAALGSFPFWDGHVARSAAAAIRSEPLLRVRSLTEHFSLSTHLKFDYKNVEGFSVTALFNPKLVLKTLFLSSLLVLE